VRIYLIIPAHKESKRIPNLISDYSTALCSNYKNSLKLIVVTDPYDKTAEVASKLTKGMRSFNIITNPRREGKGGAITRILHNICVRKDAHSSDIIGYVDADDSIKGHEVKRLIQMMQKSKYDGIIGSRYSKGSKIIGKISKGRYIASRSYNILVRVLFGLKFKDTQCGIKLFRAGALCKIIGKLSLVEMSFDVNLLYELQVAKANIHETPITFYQKNEGSNVHLLRQAPQMFIATIGYRISRSRFSKLFPDKIKGFIYEKVKGW